MSNLKYGVAAFAGIVMAFMGGYYADRTNDSDNPVTTHPTKSFGKVDIRKKTVITLHHTTTEGPFDKNADFHVKTRGYPGIAYWGGIRRDGSFEKFHDVDVISWHSRGQNTYSIGLVFEGNLEEIEPTPEQIATAKILIASLEIVMPNINEVKGHFDMPGAATLCPGKHLEPYIEELNNIVKNEKIFSEHTNNFQNYYYCGHPSFSSDLVLHRE